MLAVLPPIIVFNTKITFVYNFLAPLINTYQKGYKIHNEFSDNTIVLEAVYLTYSAVRSF